MNLVVDTNIVFSTLLNPKSSIGDVLINFQDAFGFYAPELLKEELARYQTKILTYTKLSIPLLHELESILLSSLHFVSEELIREQSWQDAFALTKDVDEDDTPFVALAIELKAKLWTGDKTLARGLLGKGADLIITTDELIKLLR